MEGILCGTLGDSMRSRMCLMAKANVRLLQILAQLHKLEGVREVNMNEDFDHKFFYRLEEIGIVNKALKFSQKYDL